MDSETAAFVMGVNGDTHLKRAKEQRRRNQARTPLRAGFGVYYGVGAYGSPIGQVTGVQQQPPAPEAPLGEQWGGGGMDMGSGGGEGGGTGQ